MTQQTQHSTKTSEKAAATGAAKKLQAEQDAAAERHRMIAEAAYIIAEQRGFQGDLALDDWLQAEAEVDVQSAARH